MKLIVTGASGNIGHQLVPHWLARGVELLLVGRDAEKLRRQFPGIAVCQYEDLDAKAPGFDALINLAVVNSDSNASEREYTEINVDLPLRLAAVASAAGISRFIYVSSLQALDERVVHHYAASKRAGRAKLQQAGHDLEIIAVYLPATYGERWTGRWSFMNNLRGAPKSWAVTVLTAFKPAIDIDTLAAKLTDILEAENPSSDIVVSSGQRDNAFYQVVRRLVDIAAGVFILLVFWWLLLAIWVAIKLRSPGPGIFSQQRVGRRGEIFTCYKFRTMHAGTLQAATHELKGTSVTAIGKVLRRTKLDELPQAWNLLTGEMTLVGPRPCLPSQTELIYERSQAGVLELTPGITGLAQVNGVDMSDPRTLVVYDQRYLKMQNLLLDFKLVILTVVGNGRGDRVAS